MAGVELLKTTTLADVQYQRDAFSMIIMLTDGLPSSGVTNLMRVGMKHRCYLESVTSIWHPSHIIWQVTRLGKKLLVDILQFKNKNLNENTATKMYQTFSVVITMIYKKRIGTHFLLHFDLVGKLCYLYEYNNSYNNYTK